MRGAHRVGAQRVHLPDIAQGDAPHAQRGVVRPPRALQAVRARRRHRGQRRRRSIALAWRRRARARVRERAGAAAAPAAATAATHRRVLRHPHARRRELQEAALGRAPAAVPAARERPNQPRPDCEQGRQSLRRGLRRRVDQQRAGPAGTRRRGRLRLHERLQLVCGGRRAGHGHVLRPRRALGSARDTRAPLCTNLDET
mmetsp:Transcript_3279/g.13287  ORF Transcript_3279/g.13287 Transcript_3279/m.13287 type:complete len:200 (+) Transcript_3279:395-994(+)